MYLDSVRQVCEKKPFVVRNVYYYSYNLIFVMLHNSYFNCTCKYQYWKDHNPTLIGKICPSCQIGDGIIDEELQKIKNSRVKLLLFYNQLRDRVEEVKTVDQNLADLFSIDYEYKFKDFSSGYSSSIYLKDYQKLYW